MAPPVLVVMAAGLGSRYGGLKQIEPIGPDGERLVDYSIFDARRAGFGRVVFVIRRAIEHDFRSAIGARLEARLPVEYAFQELDDPLPRGFTVPPGRTRPWGTVQTVLAAERLAAGPFAIVNADDFYGLDAFRALAGFLNATPARGPHHYAVVGYVLSETLSESGGVSRAVCEREGETLVRIREIKKIERDDHGVRGIDERGTVHRLDPASAVSMNMWGFTPAVFDQLRPLFEEFLRRDGRSPTAELVVPTAIGTLLDRGEAQVSVLQTTARWFGITHRDDQARAAARIRALIDRGEYPERL